METSSKANLLHVSILENCHFGDVYKRGMLLNEICFTYWYLAKWKLKCYSKSLWPNCTYTSRHFCIEIEHFLGHDCERIVWFFFVASIVQYHLKYHTSKNLFLHIIIFYVICLKKQHKVSLHIKFCAFRVNTGFKF